MIDTQRRTFSCPNQKIVFLKQFLIGVIANAHVLLYGTYMPDNQTPQQPQLPRQEEAILELWKQTNAFERSIEQRKRKNTGRFVFYEGPPTANGRPGIHHVLARAFKDIILRYKTMRGFFVERRGGWDTHGLPVEIEVEKQLGLHSKKEIEQFGIAKFNQTARASIWRYKEEWERLSERMGFWIDMRRPYVTCETTYMETIWWIISTLHKKELLYQDDKIAPWCPRCETTLSSFEVAQGYSNVSDEALYVKLKRDNASDEHPTYFLVWTTTPWTLSGNVALAVHPKAEYVVIEEAETKERFILARERLPVFKKAYTEISALQGEALVGQIYIPLYRADGAPYRVVGADFVTTTDGTGIVHIAPAFGADDMAVAKKESLPVLMSVDERGLMKAEGRPWHRRFFKEANPLIRDDLLRRRLLWKSEHYEHDYPFCWRCRSPLMYYRRNAWWFRTTAVRDRMIEANKKIGWHPDYLRDGRFGEWLAENIDWNMSRERYWGTPLPLWRCTACGAVTPIESLAALDAHDPSPTTLYLARHGEASSNLERIIHPPFDTDKHQSTLTDAGIAMIEKHAERLAKERVDVILVSPLRRTRQTAELYAQRMGRVETLVREELREIDVGSFVGKKEEEYRGQFPTAESRLDVADGEGEGLRAVRRRVMGIVEYIRAFYRGKRVLIVSHGDPLWILGAALEGTDESLYAQSWYPNVGEIKKIPLHNFPYNMDGDLDLHRPYVDAITVRCSACAGEARRLPDVADVWFDSGSMPFASVHYPFENAALIDKKQLYPADYICEAVDQTRGWFYTLLAVSALLGFPAPYRTVLSLGLVIDAKGQKMSKSRGNAVDPWELFERYGADAVRWYFFTVNQPWDEKRFDERNIADAARRFFVIAANVLRYWETYASAKAAGEKPPKTAQKINAWLAAYTKATQTEVARFLDAYDIVKAARVLEEYMVEGLSHWYVRRIRSDMKTPSSPAAKEHAATFGWALREFAKMLAPFAPFFAEQCYQTVSKTAAQSVHWEDWDIMTKKELDNNTPLLSAMNTARSIVSLALEQRTKYGIKVRQPLSLLVVSLLETVPDQVRKEIESVSDLIQGEINVQAIRFEYGKNIGVQLDTILTPELKEEGILRELARHIQSLRKEKGLQPGEPVELRVAANRTLAELFRKHEDFFRREAGIKKTHLAEDASLKEIGKRVVLEGQELWFAF